MFEDILDAADLRKVDKINILQKIEFQNKRELRDTSF